MQQRQTFRHPRKFCEKFLTPGVVANSLKNGTVTSGDTMTDITTKIILAVIALGVWVNIFTFASPDRQAAVQEAVQDTDRNVSVIADNISWITGGVCHNGKLC